MKTERIKGDRKITEHFENWKEVLIQGFTFGPYMAFCGIFVTIISPFIVIYTAIRPSENWNWKKALHESFYIGICMALWGMIITVITPFMAIKAAIKPNCIGYQEECNPNPYEEEG